MRLLVSGSTGFVGRALVRSLAADGHTVHRLVRTNPVSGDATFDDGHGALDTSRLPGGTLSGLDAVVHLAGAPLGGGLWTERRRREIRDSRIVTTTCIVEALAACDAPPGVFVCASAVGWYGDRGEEVLDESSKRGTGFLAALCADWELTAAGAESSAVRVVNLRSGIVLGPRGGVLKVQLPAFRLGLGARLGSGSQWTSFIALDDEVRAIRHVIADADVRGPVNLVAPDPVTNAEMTVAIAAALGRRARLGIPASAMRLALGRQLADELLLASQRVVPGKLLASGFSFELPSLDQAVATAVAPAAGGT